MDFRSKLLVPTFVLYKRKLLKLLNNALVENIHNLTQSYNVVQPNLWPSLTGGRCSGKYIQS